MSHRIDIGKAIEYVWLNNPRFKDTSFRRGKIFDDTNLPKVGFYQRYGGSVEDTTGAAFIENLQYVFEIFGQSEEQLEDIVNELEATYDRIKFETDGKRIVSMTRTAPTLVEEVGVGNWRAIATYSVRANLSRRYGEK